MICFDSIIVELACVYEKKNENEKQSIGKF